MKLMTEILGVLLGVTLIIVVGCMVFWLIYSFIVLIEPWTDYITEEYEKWVENKINKIRFAKERKKKIK